MIIILMAYYFIIAFLLSLVLTPILIFAGNYFGLVSKPRKRDVHTRPLPRIGGVGIALSFVIASFIAFYFHKDLSFNSLLVFSFDSRFLGIIIGGLFISLFMLFDDIRGLNAPEKLFIQIVATLFVIASGTGIDSLTNPFGGIINLNSVYIPIITLNGVTYHFSLWSDLLTLAWMVGMMNIINFVDGVDGLAAGLSSIAFFIIFLLSVSLAVNQPSTALLAIILAGSTFGFLVWNFPPAKIFMGDTGSMFLGFMLGVLPLISGGKLATVFLVLGFPIIDGIIVALTRLAKGKNPLTTPDKTHLHHRFLKAGFTPRQAILSMYGVAVAFGWVALRSSTQSKIEAAFVLVLAIIGVIILLEGIARVKRVRQ